MRRICVPFALAALATPYAFGQAPSSPAQQHTSLAVAPADLAAAGSSPLTLERAVQAALARNPLIRAAEAEFEATRGALDQAGVRPNPTLGVDQEDTRRDTSVTTVMLSQAIELGGKRTARVELARRGQDVAKAELATRRADVRATTIRAFFDALIAQERVKVAEESLSIATSGAAAAARRVLAGKVASTEETRARVAEANSRIEVRQAQADRAAALRALTLALGMPTGSISLLDGRAEALPRLPEMEALAQRVEQAPALRLARSQVERASAAYEVERSRRLPDVTLSVGMRRAQELGRSQPMIGVSIPLPLFDSNRGGQLEALRKRDAAQAMAQAEEQRIRSETLQSLDQLQARSDEVAALQRDVLPGAQSAYEAASRGFELGKFSFLDVLDAQRTFLQARTQYLNALAETHRAAAEIERRLGGPAEPTDRTPVAPQP